MERPAILGGLPLMSEDSWPQWPQWGECERSALLGVLESGRWQAGHQVEAFESRFASYQDAAHAVCVTNGTTSLELALRASDIGPGDEVIVPSYTFAATALAVLTVGASPVLVDVDSERLNLDTAACLAAIGERTRAIIPVHVGGHPVDLDALLQMAEQHGLVVVEDAAHAHGAEWRGGRIGAAGACASFSFQTGKSMTSGDGGCLTCSGDEMAERLRSLRNFGRSEGGDLVRVGGNHRMTEMQAALLGCQLERLDAQIERRQRNVERLSASLEQVPGVRVAEADERVTRHPHYQVLLHLDAERFGLQKRLLLDALTAEGVPLEPGYEPLHRMDLFRGACAQGRGRFLPCPVAERAADESILWLSFRMALATEVKMDELVEALLKIRAHAEELNASGVRS